MKRTRIPSGVRQLLQEAIHLAFLTHPLGDPNVEDVLDHLFSPSRGDPEALILAVRLRPWVEELLEEYLPESGWEWEWERELPFGNGDSARDSGEGAEEPLH